MSESYKIFLYGKIKNGFLFINLFLIVFSITSEIRKFKLIRTKLCSIMSLKINRTVSRLHQDILRIEKWSIIRQVMEF